MKEFFAVSITSPKAQTPFSGQAVRATGATGIIYCLYAGPTPASYWANWEAGLSAAAALQPLTEYVRPESPLIFSDSVLAEVPSQALCLSTPNSFFQDRTNARVWVNFAWHYWLYDGASITRSSSLWLAETPISNDAEPVTIAGQNVYFRIQSLSLPSVSENDQFLAVRGRISFSLLNLDGLFSGLPFYGSLIEVFLYRGAREPDELGQYTKLKEGVCRSYQKTAEDLYVSAELLTQTLRFLISLPKAADIFPAVFTDPVLAVPMPLQNGESVVPVIAGYRFIALKPIYSSGKVPVNASAKPDKQFSTSVVSIGGTDVVCLQQYLDEDSTVAIQRDYFIKPTGAGTGTASSVSFIGAVGAGLWLGADGEQFTGAILAIETLAFDSYASTPYEFLAYLLNIYSNFPFSSAIWDSAENAWVQGKVYPCSFTLDKNLSFNEVVAAFKIFQLMILQKKNGTLALRSKLYPLQTVRDVHLTKPPAESVQEPELYASLAVTFQSINTDNFKTSKSAFIRDSSQAAAVRSRYHIVSELALEIPVPLDEFQAALNALERIYQQPRRTYTCECLTDYTGAYDLLNIEVYDLVRVDFDDPLDAGFGGVQTLICTAVDYRSKTITLEELL